jgi:MATE family multidrug resistance protein
MSNRSLPKTPAPGGMREMIAIALPMVVSFACDTVMTFTDRLFLSKLGPAHMSAAMGGGLSCFMMMSFFLGLIGYMTALVAQYFGANQKHNCSKVVTQAAIVIIFAYPVLLLARPWAHALFTHSHLDAQQLSLQIQYFDIMMFGVILTLGRHALSCYFSGIGRTRIVMFAAICAMIINAVANYGLIYGHFGLPALGITGSALGTIIGGGSGFLILLAVYLQRRNAETFGVKFSFVFDMTIMRKLLRFGYPAGIEMTLNIVAFTLMVMMFHGQGLIAATATTIVFNWDMVTFVPLLGFEIAVTSLVGRYLGAGQPEFSHWAVKSGLTLGFLYSLIMVVAFVVFPQQLVAVFRPEGTNAVFAEALPLAVSMVKFIPLYISAVAVLIVYVGALRGAGDTLWAMLITTGIHWITMAAIFISLYGLKSSTLTAWAVLVFGFLGLCWLPYWRYRQGKWRKINLVDADTTKPSPSFF